MPRKNGFDQPRNVYQMISWVHYLFNSIVISVFVLPELHELLFIVIFPLFLISYMSVFVFTLVATCSNPSANQKQLQFVESDLVHYELFCEICRIYVNEQTKHCGKCNRCVNTFDHHCKWVNNCIGQPNYKWFLGLISSLQISTMTTLAACITVMLTTHEFYTIVLLLINTLLNSIIGIFNGYLICFHIYIRCKKITTYEYLILKRRIGHKYSNTSIVPHPNVRTEHTCTKSVPNES